MASSQAYSVGCSALVYNDEQLVMLAIASTDVYLFQVEIGSYITNRAGTEWFKLLPG